MARQPVVPLIGVEVTLAKQEFDLCCRGRGHHHLDDIVESHAGKAPLLPAHNPEDYAGSTGQ